MSQVWLRVLYNSLVAVNVLNFHTHTHTLFLTTIVKKHFCYKRNHMKLLDTLIVLLYLSINN